MSGTFTITFSEAGEGGAGKGEVLLHKALRAGVEVKERKEERKVDIG